MFCFVPRVEQTNRRRIRNDRKTYKRPCAAYRCEWFSPYPRIVFPPSVRKKFGALRAASIDRVRETITKSFHVRHVWLGRVAAASAGAVGKLGRTWTTNDVRQKYEIETNKRTMGTRIISRLSPRKYMKICHENKKLRKLQPHSRISTVCRLESQWPFIRFRMPIVVYKFR